MKKKTQMLRLLIIDDQQTNFNAIIQQFEKLNFSVQAKLLDDKTTFEKMVNLNWEAIIFHRAYDFDYQTAATYIRSKNKFMPIILLSDELDGKSSQAVKIYQNGVFDIVNPTALEYLCLTTHRAVLYSRLKNKEFKLTQEIDHLQQQTQTLVENTEQPIAVVQEGVYCNINPQFATFFGQSSENLIGLPMLDILQPKDALAFKNYFKRLDRGDFSQPQIIIESLNPNAKQKILTIQSTETNFDDETAIQLVITANEISFTPTLQIVETKAPTQGFAGTPQITQYFQDSIMAGKSYFALISVKDMPQNILTQAWNALTQYFDALEQQLNMLTQHTVLRISEHVFLTASDVQQQIMQLQNNRPTQLSINGQTYPLELAIAVRSIQTAPQAEQLNAVLSDIFNTHDNIANNSNHAVEMTATSSQYTAISTNPVQSSTSGAITNTVATHTHTETEPLSQIKFGHAVDTPTAILPDFTNNLDNQSEMAVLLRQIEQNEIVLSYQQIYDKEDIDTHIYEVNASFNLNEQSVALKDYKALKNNPDISIQLDRWVLVEAAKQMHQLQNEMPKLRIAVNLHLASLQDKNLYTLIVKLVNLIHSKYAKPLILQFNEEDILTHIDAARHQFNILNEQNIAISVCQFGLSSQSHLLLENFNHLSFVQLAESFSENLQNDDSIIALQEKLEFFKESDANVKFLLKNLNDMSSFANAWNVDVRYLQGQYFQSPNPKIINSSS